MSVWRYRNALLLMVGSFISYLGNGMHFIGLTWLVFSITKTSTSIGILIAFEIIPGIITSPFTGVIADRYNKKWIAIITDLFRGLAVLIIPFALWTGKVELWMIYLATVLITCGNNLFFPTLIGFDQASRSGRAVF